VRQFQESKRAPLRRLNARFGSGWCRRCSAERASRAQRKYAFSPPSLGTQSEAGDRFVERILSIRETCRLNDQSLHNYLIQVHHSRLTAAEIPIPLGIPQVAA